MEIYRLKGPTYPERIDPEQWTLSDKLLDFKD